MIRCPDRRFAFAGDSGFDSHEIARVFVGHHGRLPLVGMLHA
jgi:hypothetical protein